MAKHEHDIGRCDYCRQRVVTVMDIKDHTIAGISTAQIAGLRSGFAWSEKSNLKTA